MGQNAYFYESAEGIITAAILLISEFCPPEKRHIISVFKLIQDLLAPSNVKGKTQFSLLIEKLPPEHKARWFAGAALNTAEQAMMIVMSTALSRLNAFLPPNISHQAVAEVVEEQFRANETFREREAEYRKRKIKTDNRI